MLKTGKSLVLVYNDRDFFRVDIHMYLQYSLRCSHITAIDMCIFVMVGLEPI